MILKNSFKFFLKNIDSLGIACQGDAPDHLTWIKTEHQRRKPINISACTPQPALNHESGSWLCFFLQGWSLHSVDISSGIFENQVFEGFLFLAVGFLLSGCRCHVQWIFGCVGLQRWKGIPWNPIILSLVWELDTTLLMEFREDSRDVETLASFFQLHDPGGNKNPSEVTSLSVFLVCLCLSSSWCNAATKRKGSCVQVTIERQRY